MIIIRIWEGLGNQMFQYAYARFLAQNRADVFLDLNKAYDNSFHKLITSQQRKTKISYFNITVPSVDVERMGHYFYLRRENGIEYLITELARKGMWPYTFIEEKDPDSIPRISKWNRSCYVKGWFQNINAFSDIRDVLIKEFTPKQKIKISGKMREEIFEKNSVAVHVRRGDYVTNNIALPAKYYGLAKAKIEERIKDPVYIVFSDDHEWVKNHIDFGERAIYVDDMANWEDYEQLFAMSKCKHQIMANSTFSWWAAWLNQNQDKMIVMPKQYILAMPALKIEKAVVI